MTPTFSLRPVQDQDLTQVVSLDRLSFAPLSSDAEIEQQWFKEGLKLPDRHFFLAVETATGEGVGCYGQLDLEFWLAGEKLPLMGIAAVAVAPHRRGQRVAGLMLDHAVKMAQEQNFPLIMLYPFQHGFYRKLGWAWVGQTQQYRVAATYLPTYPERSQICPYQPDQHGSEVPRVYQLAAQQHQGWLQRRDWQWQSRLKPTGQELYVYLEAGNLLGYVIFRFALLDPPQNSLTAIVQEWVALTPAAYRGIIGFLGSLRDQVATIIWNTYPGDPFPHLLKEQRRSPVLRQEPFEFGLTHRFGEIGGGFMWRLVDLERAISNRPIQPVPPFLLTFEVQDPILGASQITVSFVDRQMHLVPEQASLSVKLSIEQLTLLFAGVRRSTDLLWLGEIAVQANNPTVEADILLLLTHLDTAWTLPAPFCWDFF